VCVFARRTRSFTITLPPNLQSAPRKVLRYPCMYRQHIARASADPAPKTSPPTSGSCAPRCWITPRMTRTASLELRAPVRPIADDCAPPGSRARPAWALPSSATGGPPYKRPPTCWNRHRGTCPGYERLRYVLAVLAWCRALAPPTLQITLRLCWAITSCWRCVDPLAGLCAYLASHVSHPPALNVATGPVFFCRSLLAVRLHVLP